MVGCAWFVRILTMPGGYIPTLETKQRECWKVYPRLTRDFDSRVHGQPSVRGLPTHDHHQSSTTSRGKSSIEIHLLGLVIWFSQFSFFYRDLFWVTGREWSLGSLANSQYFLDSSDSSSRSMLIGAGKMTQKEKGKYPTWHL